jgi:hypothetical protein
MKAKFGSLVVGGSGKIGGHVVTKNRQGYALRTKVTPINRRSSDQTTQRQNFTGQSQVWRTLTASQRSAWEAFAANISKSNIWGDKYAPTGKNAFQLINMNLLLAGGTVVTDPPATTPATALTSFAVASNTTSAQTLSFAASPVPTGMKLVIFATRPLSAGVGSAGARFRKFTTVAAAATSPANTFSAYQTKFGTPVSGQKIFFKCKVINTTTGQVAASGIVSSITA